MKLETELTGFHWREYYVHYAVVQVFTSDCPVH